MNRIAFASLAAAALALAGCSSSTHNDKPTPTVTVTKTPKLSAAEQRQACVDAWAKAVDDKVDDASQTPAPCDRLPDDEQVDLYMKGLQQRNQANRDAAQKCLDDPTCTALPVP